MKELVRPYYDLLVRQPADRRRLVLLLVMMTIGAAMEALGVGLIMPFIALLQKPELLHDWKSIEMLARLVGVKTATGATILVGALLLIVFVVKNIYLAITTWAQLKFVGTRMTYLSRDMLAGYLS